MVAHPGLLGLAGELRSSGSWSPASLVEAIREKILETLVLHLLLGHVAGEECLYTPIVDPLDVGTGL